MAKCYRNIDILLCFAKWTLLGAIVIGLASRIFVDVHAINGPWFGIAVWVASGCIGALAVARFRRHWALPDEPTCRRCGYILRGLTQPRCPECGTPFDAARLRSLDEKTREGD